MKRALLSTILVVAVTALAAAVPPILTHQGRITVQSVNFDGTGQFKFALVDSAGTTTHWSNDGTSTAGSEPTDAVSITVTKGLYSVDLGDTNLTNMIALTPGVFDSGDVWLRVWFSDGVNGFQLLTPDQHLTSVPFAMRTDRADTIDGGSIINPSFIGTNSDTPLDFFVNNERGLRLLEYSDGLSVIGGSSSNLASPLARSVTIFGGRSGSFRNEALNSFATISGGYDNQAGESATVGGGSSNNATALRSTIAGGGSNDAAGQSATVGGGEENVASGQFSTIPGGDDNEAAGDYSFAAGRKAKSLHEGSFVWADSIGFSGTDFESTTANQFNARASGGVRLFVEGTGTHGLRMEYASRTSGSSSGVNFVVGHALNGVDSDYVGAVVLGGGDDNVTVGNRATGSFATILGGTANQAYFGAVVAGGNTNESGGVASAIGGGQQNSISVNGSFGTIAGGLQNQVTSWAGTVAGGELGTASGSRAAVGGGGNNTASGSYSSVPGGSTNTASGDYSLAAGRRAMAANNGSFVWADSTDADFASTATDQFLIRANGGVGINTTDTSMAALTVSGTVKASEFRHSGSLLKVGNIDNFPVEIHINSLPVFRLEHVVDPTNSLEGANITGGMNTSVDAGKTGAVVFGGEANEPNSASTFGTVSGGSDNSSVGVWAVVGGGRENSAGTFSTVSGGEGNNAASLFSTIGGGQDNSVTNQWATISGGQENTISGAWSTVGGGYRNNVTGQGSTIPGGVDCVASGSYSLAAGSEAKALHDGAFVWSDGTLTGGVESTLDYQFTALASGGVRFFTSSSGTSGVYVTAGGGAWATISDRNQKENFKPASHRFILEKVAELPIATWNYKAEGAGVRHVGPMAQDFHAAFGLGDSDRSITTVDADGIALAAIQGLNEKVDEHANALSKENRLLREQNDRLKARLEKLEAVVETLID